MKTSIKSRVTIDLFIFNKNMFFLLNLIFLGQTNIIYFLNYVKACKAK